MSFAPRVVHPGRPYIWKLIDRIRGFANPRHFIKITGEICKDCAMWLSFLQELNWVPLITPMRDLSYSHRAFSSDASDWGFAAVFHNEWFQAQWPPAWMEKHINLTEFVPNLFALHILGGNWHHAILTFHCDNRVVVEVIMQLYSRDPGMLVILGEIVQLSLHQDLVIQAKQLLGKFNAIADFLSHSQADATFLLKHELHS